MLRPRVEHTRVLAHAKKHAPQAPTKSSIMLGLSETMDEVRETMRDLRAAATHAEDGLAVALHLLDGT